MKKDDALSVTGLNFLATMTRSLCLNTPLGIQNRKHFSIGVQQILLTVTCMLCMNLACAQPIVKVTGSSDSVTVLKQVAQYLEYLDIRENVGLAVIFTRTMPEEYAGITICVNGADLKKDIGYLNIKVYLDAAQPKSRQRIVLAHEMIHVKQYAKGELCVNSRHEVVWKGQKYSSHNTEYGDPRPWEREAYRNDALLVKHFEEQTEMFIQISKTDAYVDHTPDQKQISDFRQKY